MKRTFLPLSAFFLLTSHFVFAGSATWNLNPTSGDWNTAANWRPRTIPNGPDDTATFSISRGSNISVGSSIIVSDIVFDSGASPFTITATSGNVILSGSGITNNSGLTQNFVTNPFRKEGWTFTNQATAGSQTTFTVVEASRMAFYDDATAGSATLTVLGTVTFEDENSQILFNDSSSAANGVFINTGGAGDYQSLGGVTEFFGNSTAANGSFTNKGATTIDAYSGGSTDFLDSSSASAAVISNEPGATAYAWGGTTNFSGQTTAQDASITCEGADLAGAVSGELRFFDTSFGGNAILIANGGSNGGYGGLIQFYDSADGGTARIELFGNGTLDTSGITNVDGVSIGSLEGDGIVTTGTGPLTIGTNNLSTVFSGVIQGNGGIVKDGVGTLTLSGANTYNGSTVVNKGFLRVENRIGSATGSGPVIVSFSTLGGSGIIGGSVNLYGSGELAPGVGGTTLTIKKRLQFGLRGSYTWRVRTTSAKADKVVAGAQVTNGVVISTGAQFFGIAIGNTVLSPGTTFTAIDNASPDSISGTFPTLPDGGKIRIGNNTYQANYEGGDGNDLTLTVQ